MSWIEGLCLLAIAVYVLRTAFFGVGAWRQWRHSRRECLPAGSTPAVSVIIPARNEEHTIARCVESVFACRYPSFEVLVVNDRSTDGTEAVLEELQRRYGERLRVFHRREEPRVANLQGKAGALHIGVEHARGEILLFTDADCRVPPTWIATMVAPFAQPAVGFVAGFVLVEGKRFFDLLQAAEWLLLNAAGSGGIGWGQALGCFGNNLAVRAQAYWDTGGYERIPFSVTEDLGLQQAVHRCGWRMVYCHAPEAVVETLPVATLAERIRQLRRWGQGGRRLGLWAVAFMLTTALFFGALAGAGVAGEWLWMVGVLAARCGADTALGALAALSIRRPRLLWMVPVASAFLMVMEGVLPLLVYLQPQVRWKGRVLA